MIKGIKYFLITSVALGFLQIDTSAMKMKRDDEDSNNNNLVTKIKSDVSNPIENKKAECPEENDQNNKIASILENIRDLIQENGKIRELQQTSLSRMQQQSEEINALQAKINPLLQENETLSRKVSALQEKIIHSRPLRAIFSYPVYGGGWVPYTNANWAPITFEHFQGDESLRGNLSTVKIPEDGFYSLYAHYAWRADAKGNTGAYTAISVNDPTNGYLDKYFVDHHLARGFQTIGGLRRDAHLKKGDKVMVSISASPHAEYYLGHFLFNIEKIH